MADHKKDQDYLYKALTQGRGLGKSYTASQNAADITDLQRDAAFGAKLDELAEIRKQGGVVVTMKSSQPELPEGCAESFMRNVSMGIPMDEEKE